MFLTPVYQVILAMAAVMGVVKYLRQDKGWYKTARMNQHRAAGAEPADQVPAVGGMIDADPVTASPVTAAASTSPVRPVAPYVPPPAEPSWITRYLKNGALLAGSLVIVGAAMAWNLQGYPGRANDDEGTYVDRGWAMLATHHLSNYTYYWDHPFLGWATIAAWAELTDGFARDARSVMVGRELMWVACLASGVLLYVLARRIDIKRPFAALAVVLFGASPLDIWYHRMVSLDNLATVWALAALVLAASRRRSWGAAIGSGACFAVAFWNKETILLLFPVMVWLLYQHTDASTRFANLSSFCVVAFSGIAFYPLLAVLKGELLPGAGTRQPVEGAGRLPADPARHGQRAEQDSGTFLQFHSWVTLDPWLVLGGGAAVSPDWSSAGSGRSRWACSCSSRSWSRAAMCPTRS